MAKDFVLVCVGDGTYVARRVVSYNGESYFLSNGHYSTEYKKEDVHKCPSSISKSIKE